MLTALLLAATAGGMVGESLLQDVRTGVTVTGAWNTIPQIICLIALGRLAAALIHPVPSVVPVLADRLRYSVGVVPEPGDFADGRCCGRRRSPCLETL